MNNLKQWNITVMEEERVNFSSLFSFWLCGVESVFLETNCNTMRRNVELDLMYLHTPVHLEKDKTR